MNYYQGVHDRVTQLYELLRLIVISAVSDRVTFLAASIAFYAMLSIFPLFLLILVAGSLLGSEEFAIRVVGILSDILTPEAEAVLETAIRSESGRGGAGVAGFLLLTWSAIKLFRGLAIAFAQVYPDVDDPSFFTTIAYALVVLIAIVVGVLAIFVVRTYVRLFPAPELVAVISPIIVFLTICVVFFPMYYIFPGGRQRVTAVLPGTLFAAIGWTLLGELFAIYAANAGTYALFGVIGAVLLMLMWFYFGAILLLLGAVVNAVLAGRTAEKLPLFEDGTESALGMGSEESDDPQ